MTGRKPVLHYHVPMSNKLVQDHGTRYPWLAFLGMLAIPFVIVIIGSLIGALL